VATRTAVGESRTAALAILPSLESAMVGLRKHSAGHIDPNLGGGKRSSGQMRVSV